MSSTHLNLARAICRRAERSVYPLVQGESVDAEVGRYLNRLSDFLFAATRAAALREGREELLWIKAVLPKGADDASIASVAAKESFDARGTGAAVGDVSGASVSARGSDTGDATHGIHDGSEGGGVFGGMDDDFFDPTGPSGGKGGGDGPILAR